MSMIAQFFSSYTGSSEPETPKRSLVPLERVARPKRALRPTREELAASLHEEAAMFSEERSSEMFSRMAPERVDLS